MKKHVLLSICLCSLGIHKGTAQSIGPSTLNSTGGGTTIGTNTYEWSVGEMTLVNTFAATGVTVTQGILQPARSTTGITAPGIGASELRVFPVPATDALYVRPSFTGGGSLQLVLLDAAGRTMLRKDALLTSGTEQQELNIAALSTGNYLLQVSYEQNGTLRRQSFKVQKAH